MEHVPMLANLARTCFRRRKRVLAVWILAFVAINVVAGAVGADYRASMSLPDSESRDVQELLEAGNPERGGGTAQIVFAAPNVRDPQVQEQMEGLFATIATLDPNMAVVSPYSEQGQGQINDAGTVAFAELQVSDRDYNELLDLGKKIEKAGEDADIQGVRIEYGSEMFGEFEMPESEALGLLAAIIILIIAFGSVIAMGLPIGTAVFGLGIGVALTTLISNVQSMPDFAPQMTAMIGLGVGIDYALFIVTRYREGLRLGLEPEDATAHAMDTSGRAVLFAGATVIISLMGLYLMGLPFVRGLATGAAFGVLMMMIAAVTLLPALIGFAGRKIEVTTYRGVIGVISVTLGLLFAILFGLAPFALLGLLVMIGVIVGSKTFAKKLATPIPHRREKPREEQFWYRWSRVVQHRPWPSFVIGLVVLLLLAAPMLSLRLGFGDTGNLNEEQTPRRAYDMLAEGFGPGFNGPIIIAVPGPPASDQAALDQFTSQLESAEGVALVQPPIPLRPDLALVQLYADSAPQDKATTELVHHLRNDVIPASAIGGALVGGFNAASVDFAD
jgi:putative drug exporter of the RND superfamily